MRLIHARVFFMTVFFAVVALMAADSAHAAIKIRFKSSNNTTDERSIKVRYILPTELSRTDILSAGGLKVDWDTQTKSYYVHDTIIFAPGETKEFVLQVNDVWQIPEAEVAKAKKYLEKKVLAFQEDENFDRATVWKENLEERISAIEASRTEQYEGISQRIHAYRTNMERLNGVKEAIFSIDAIEDLLDDASDGRVVNLRVGLNNPSPDKPAVKKEVIHYLPKEVKPKDIISDAIFEVRYDPEQKLYYLYAHNVELAPGEKAKHVIQVKDIWFISEIMLQAYQKEAQRISDVLQVTEYAEIAKVLVEEIMSLSSDIIQLQNLAESLRDRMANYEDNKKKLERIKNKLNELKDYRTRMKDLIEKLQIDEKTLKTDDMKTAQLASSTAPKIQKDAVSAGKMMAGIIGFIFVMTAIFYIFWMVQSGKIESKKFERLETKDEK